MRFGLVLTVMIGVSGQAAAQDTAALTEAISACLSLPIGAADAVITMDILFGERGVPKDVAVVEYEPQSELGKAAVMAATRAVLRCAPYIGVPEGVVRVTFREEPAPAIDPFTPLDTE